jgi:hypothetical protein
MDQAKQDRKLALEAYEMYKRAFEQNPADALSKKLMLESLDVAQRSRESTVKAVDLVIRLEDSDFKVKKPATAGNALTATPNFKDLIDIEKAFNDKKTTKL